MPSQNLGGASLSGANIPLRQTQISSEFQQLVNRIEEIRMKFDVLEMKLSPILRVENKHDTVVGNTTGLPPMETLTPFADSLRTASINLLNIDNLLQTIVDRIEL